MSSAPTATPRKEPARRRKLQTGRAIDFDDEEEKPVKLTASATQSSQQTSDSSVRIEKNDKSANTAYKWFREDPDRFAKYRNYIKTHDEELTAEIQGHGKSKKSEVAKWVLANVGFVPDTDTRAMTIQNIVDIAIVAAGLTNNGVAKLEREYDAENMDNLQNAYYHAYSLRKNESQQEARKQSKSEQRHKKHAAHYVGLEVGMKLNNALPPEQRVDGDALRDALNILKNMRLVLAQTNLSVHKQVDQWLLDVTDHGALTSVEYDRLKQIAKHAQSAEFQQVMADATNGRHLYLALRDRISSFDTSGRPRLWDARKDRRDLQRPSTASKSSGRTNNRTS